MTGAALHIVRPGLLTTVQDLGRYGHQASGVPVAGPMDTFSHRLANQLAGNAIDAATLEITLIGPDLIVEADTTIAIAGAQFEVTCDDRPVALGASFAVTRGQRLKFGRIVQGARAYLAVAGGIQTPPVLGSRATHLVSRMGGLNGRALQSGDRVPIGNSPQPRPQRKSAGLTLPSKGRALLRVMPGPQADWFQSDALRAIASVSFRISPQSNRMGYRLQGPPLVRAREDELISEPLGIGAIQVPAAGEPILLDGRSANRRWLSQDWLCHCGRSADCGPAGAGRLHRVPPVHATGSRDGADRARAPAPAIRGPEGRSRERS